MYLLPRPQRGLRGIVFTRSVCVCVCPADILVFYFSAIGRDIDLKLIQDTYRVVLNSLKKIDLHRSKVKVTGTVHWFLKVQSYHKNFFVRHFLGYSIRWNNKNLSEQRNDVTKVIRQYLTLTCKTPIPKLLILIKLSIKIKWQSYSPVLLVFYQCAKFGDDRMSFNVIFDLCDV